jgi:hypothetical protein
VSILKHHYVVEYISVERMKTKRRGKGKGTYIHMYNNCKTLEGKKKKRKQDIHT